MDRAAKQGPARGGRALPVRQGLWLLLALALWMPNGHDPAAAQAQDAAWTSTQVQLDAKSEWRHTGLMLQKGDALVISAEGRWSNTADGAADKGPAGYPNNKRPTSTAPQFDFASLIGKVGDVVFEIGRSYTGASPADGELLVAMNDDPGTFGDNQGGLILNIRAKVAPTAEPTASATGGLSTNTATTSDASNTATTSNEVANVEPNETGTASANAVVNDVAKEVDVPITTTHWPHAPPAIWLAAGVIALVALARGVRNWLKRRDPTQAHKVGARPVETEPPVTSITPRGPVSPGLEISYVVDLGEDEISIHPPGGAPS
jgi:hypothetical protein